jgi:hypothetical protein
VLSTHSVLHLEYVLEFRFLSVQLLLLDDQPFFGLRFGSLGVAKELLAFFPILLSLIPRTLSLSRRAPCDNVIVKLHKLHLIGLQLFRKDAAFDFDILPASNLCLQRSEKHPQLQRDCRLN